MTKDWYPEFVYEEGSKIPFVVVPIDQVMPDKIFVQEYKETGETETAEDEDGDLIEVPKCDVDIHLYFNYNIRLPSSFFICTNYFEI